MTRPVEKDMLTKVQTQLTTEQLQSFFNKTPKEKIKQRPAKGGGFWKYVSGSYTTQVLNSVFGFNWSFEVVTSMSEALATANTGTVVVQGRLKVLIGDHWITKEQFGRKDVTYRKGTTDLLDFGNDLKAAATDAKKKCASELGLFADVYSQEDFFEANPVEKDKVSNKWVPSDDKSMNTIQESSLKNLAHQHGYRNDEDLNTFLWNEYGIGLKDLTETQAQQVIDDLDTKGKTNESTNTPTE